jgi:hypothetical protein
MKYKDFLLILIKIGDENIIGSLIENYFKNYPATNYCDKFNTILNPSEEDLILEEDKIVLAFKKLCDFNVKIQKFKFALVDNGYDEILIEANKVANEALRDSSEEVEMLIKAVKEGQIVDFKAFIEKLVDRLIKENSQELISFYRKIAPQRKRGFWEIFSCRNDYTRSSLTH